MSATRSVERVLTRDEVRLSERSVDPSLIYRLKFWFFRSGGLVGQSDRLSQKSLVVLIQDV